MHLTNDLGKGTSFTRAVSAAKSSRLQPLRFALADADSFRSLFCRAGLFQIEGLPLVSSTFI